MMKWQVVMAFADNYSFIWFACICRKPVHNKVESPYMFSCNLPLHFWWNEVFYIVHGTVVSDQAVYLLLQ